MLGNIKKSGRGSTAVRTHIGQETRVEGDVHFSGTLNIDGSITGNIIAESGDPSMLTVSEHGCIEGSVQADTVILNGNVSGDIRAGERIELGASARVNGDVYYRLIEMAMGARVNGSLIHEEASSAAVIAFGRDAATGPDTQA